MGNTVPSNLKQSEKNIKMNEEDLEDILMSMQVIYSTRYLTVRGTKVC